MQSLDVAPSCSTLLLSAAILGAVHLSAGDANAQRTGPSWLSNGAVVRVSGGSLSKGKHQGVVNIDPDGCPWVVRPERGHDLGGGVVLIALPFAESAERRIQSSPSDKEQWKEIDTGELSGLRKLCVRNPRE